MIKISSLRISFILNLQVKSAKSLILVFNVLTSKSNAHKMGCINLLSSVRMSVKVYLHLTIGAQYQCHASKWMWVHVPLQHLWTCTWSRALWTVHWCKEPILGPSTRKDERVFANLPWCGTTRPHPAEWIAQRCPTVPHHHPRLPFWLAIVRRTMSGMLTKLSACWSVLRALSIERASVLMPSLRSQSHQGKGGLGRRVNRAMMMMLGALLGGLLLWLLSLCSFLLPCLGLLAIVFGEGKDLAVSHKVI